MTAYLNKSFSVGLAGDQQYRDNWDAIFAKKPEPVEETKKAEPLEEPDPVCTCEYEDC